VISTPTPLPDDIEALKRLLVDRDALIAKLLTEIARLKRWQFGRSSATRYDAGAIATCARRFAERAGIG